MSETSSQLAVTNLLDIFERAVSGVHHLHGELIEISRYHPEETPRMIDRLLCMSDKFAAANASLPWATALSAIVNLHGDKTAQMERIESAILRFNDTDHGSYAAAFEHMTEEWRLTLRTQALALQ